MSVPPHPRTPPPAPGQAGTVPYAPLDPPVPRRGSKPAPTSLPRPEMRGGRVTAVPVVSPPAPVRREPLAAPRPAGAAAPTPAPPAAPSRLLSNGRAPARGGYVTPAQRAGEHRSPSAPRGRRPPTPLHPAGVPTDLPGPGRRRGQYPAEPNSPLAPRPPSPAQPGTDFIQAET